MKQIYLLLVTLLISSSSFSQLAISGDGNGTVNFSYGASGDWSLFNPGLDPVVLYMWIDEGMNSQTTFYGDDWNGTLVSLTWDGSAHVGSVNFNTYNWNTGGVIPTGTSLNDFNLILRNTVQNYQSDNLLASIHAYSTAVLPVEDFEKSITSIFVANDKIHISNSMSNEDYKLSIFDTMGRQIKNVTSNADRIDISELKTSIYFLVLETSEGNIVRQKILKQ